MTDYNPQRPSRNRLYRDKDRAILAGVCAGVADWTGVNRIALRLIVILLAIPFTPVIIIGYLVMWILVPKRPRDLYRDEREEAFWQEVRRAPRDGVGHLNRRFRDLDERLQRMEAWLTSSEYRIDRELRD
ncbi:envelope stress response membrane protein PspC [Wenzhouxiangella sp. AB-CW3]|uniref:envelope stress response membrane protein PspC n=1 Tax=Wenzhouxiangella sp. AB-CW3 TaxID=2771012 RepID=UPI00168B0840|nr:envelope stress response membrane protein PspC [Wenzhouxiangella sp. AB-CW3]QOC23605.1 envelope stress response membrane protein PspC [Wenzhouxiangella sp. AB-CW3]